MNSPSTAQLSDTRCLEDFLATFYQEAQFDSQGRFTVDLEHRLKKMAKFQFSQPEKFVLALIKAATLGGATSLRIVSIPDGFAIAFNGQLCSPEELNDVKVALEHKSIDPSSPRLRQLQTALNLVGQLHLRRVTLHLGEGLPSLSLQAQQIVLLEPTPSAICAEGVGQGLYLQGGGWGLMQSFFQSRICKIRRSVEDIVASRSALGPAYPALPWEGQWAQASASLVIGNGSLPGFPGSSQILGRSDIPRGRLLNSQGDLQGILVLGNSREQVEIVLVSSGVVYRRSMARGKGRSSCLILLWSQEFLDDLSYEALVECEILQKILQSIPLWVAEVEWMQLARAYFFGGKEVVWNFPSSGQIFWDYRQCALHQKEEFHLVWEDPRPLDIGKGKTFREAFQSFARLKYLPVGTTQLQTDQGFDVFEKGFLLDTLFPRQVSFLEKKGRVVPEHCCPTQMLRAGDFWACSPLRSNCQLGLNLEPLKHDATAWHYQVTSYSFQGTLVEVSAINLPRGVTLAVFHGKEELRDGFEFSDGSALLALYRDAWRHPQTRISPERHEALLQHWLLLQLWQPTAGDFVWLWTAEGKTIPLEELDSGSSQSLRISAQTSRLLNQVLKIHSQRSRKPSDAMAEVEAPNIPS